jgi:hypothetical protein
LQRELLQHDRARDLLGIGVRPGLVGRNLPIPSGPTAVGVTEVGNWLVLSASRVLPFPISGGVGGCPPTVTKVGNWLVLSASRALPFPTPALAFATTRHRYP